MNNELGFSWEENSLRVDICGGVTGDSPCEKESRTNVKQLLEQLRINLRLNRV